MDLRTCISGKRDLITLGKDVSLTCEFAGKVREAGTSAVIFSDRRGKRVCSNIFGDRDFVAECLSVDAAELLQFISEAIRSPSDPEIVEDAPFLANEIDPPDLAELPVPLFYPGDGGPYMTASIFAGGGENNCNISYHRVMVTGSREGTVRVVERDLYRLYGDSLRNGRDLPVAVAVGVSPAVAVAAAISVDFDMDEYWIAAALSRGREKGLRLFQMPNGCFVPAGSEYVLQGRLTGRKGKEGPFVDITGTRDGIREQPILVVDRIHHRDDPIFHAILPGGYEHYLLMGMPREATIFDTLTREGFEVKGVNLTSGGCSWLHAVISIGKEGEDDGFRAGKLAFGSHTSLKHVVVVDGDIDPFSPVEVEWAVATRVQADRDMKIITRQRGSSLDPSRVDDTTAKVIVDATMPPRDKEPFRKVV